MNQQFSCFGGVTNKKFLRAGRKLFGGLFCGFSMFVDLPLGVYFFVAKIGGFCICGVSSASEFFFGELFNQLQNWMERWQPAFKAEKK